MADAAEKLKTLTQQLWEVPNTKRGEIINGELIVAPRPSGGHIGGSSSLGEEIIGPFQKNKGGGPGGWWIFFEPEVEFEFETNHFVPDIAGWKKERMPYPPIHESIFRVVPDWICEFISPSSVRYDKVLKKNAYAKYGVKYYWIADPIAKTIEAYKLVENNQWLVVGTYTDDDKARIEPFGAIEIDLSAIWLPEPPLPEK